MYAAHVILATALLAVGSGCDNGDDVELARASSGQAATPPPMEFRVVEKHLAAASAVPVPGGVLVVRPPTGWLSLPPSQIKDELPLANWLSGETATFAVFDRSSGTPATRPASIKRGEFVLNGTTIEQLLYVGPSTTTFTILLPPQDGRRGEVELTAPNEHYQRLLPVIESTIGSLRFDPAEVDASPSASPVDTPLQHLSSGLSTVRAAPFSLVGDVRT